MEYARRCCCGCNRELRIANGEPDYSRTRFYFNASCQRKIEIAIKREDRRIAAEKKAARVAKGLTAVPVQRKITPRKCKLESCSKPVLDSAGKPARSSKLKFCSVPCQKQSDNIGRAERKKTKFTQACKRITKTHPHLKNCPCCNLEFANPKRA